MPLGPSKDNDTGTDTWLFPKDLTFIPPPQDPTKKPLVYPNEMP